MDTEWKRKSNGGTGRNRRTKEAERNKGSGVDMGGQEKARTLGRKE